ncbi:glycosyltransferase family 2 protein [Kordiimonas sp. SCSIO 12603]|uniref:glycosyltransferase family 2 protein n=1 Tax=Kordiimonas sp. SCSIO 12603 TaxID=2829596 RepID=UPI0021078669|nr:glycosyltransferase family 2 protein [Kordiimonas sp. SCSIO 12603]UTW60181.1 glycosyltransferase family 2 protein [Kordiimonas sp. SCSIO 12603]
MKLSIIIINWNTEDLLKDCLTSVYENAPLYPFEVIVVDNASDDDSTNMVKRDFPSAFLIENKKNLGFAAANNVGIGASSGDYILLLNSDTIVHGAVLTASLNYMDNTSSAGALGCKVLNEDGSLQHSTSQFPSLLNLSIQTLGLDHINGVKFFQRYRMQYSERNTAQAVETISGCYLLARKESFETIGLLDEDFFFFGEETDWCKRLRSSGKEVHFAPIGTITHLGGGSSKSLNHRRDLMLTQATVRLHLKHSGWFTALFVFLLLWGFNLSRAVYWAFSNSIKPRNRTNKRMRHFIGVCRNFVKAWPKEKGVSL